MTAASSPRRLSRFAALGLITFCTLGLPGHAAETETEKEDGLPQLVRQWAYDTQPGLRGKGVRFAIEPYSVPGLKDALDLGLILVRFLSAEEGQQFNEAILIHRDDTLTTFASAFGGFGLMSAVVAEGSLYYSYSFGSGIHRSHVGVLRKNGEGELELRESGGYFSDDLFVRVKEGEIVVESGQYETFNRWSSPKSFGKVRAKAAAFTIVDGAGKEKPGEGPPFQDGLAEAFSPPAD